MNSPHRADGADLAFAETPAEVSACLDAAPELGPDAARWKAARAAVRQGLAADLPDADLLVLQALDPGDLTDAERARLDAARPALDAALARHPGLETAAQRVGADMDAFDAAWTEHATPARETPARETPARETPARETPARRPAPAADRDARPAPRRSPARWVWRTAALVGVSGFVAILTTVGLRDVGFETITAQTAQTVRLPDGSTAELAAGTVLMVPERGGRRDSRQARLRSGEALFEIVHDEARPFAVETPNADVAVLGTVFTVRVKHPETERVATDVTLLSGRVDLALRGSDRAVRLAPGQTSTVAALTDPTAPSAADMGAALAFLPDLAARNESARDVARRLGERFGVTVEVAPALASEPVSATFRLADGPEAAAAALATALGGHVERRGGGGTLHVAAD